MDYNYMIKKSMDRYFAVHLAALTHSHSVSRAVLFIFTGWATGRMYDITRCTWRHHNENRCHSAAPVKRAPYTGRKRKNISVQLSRKKTRCFWCNTCHVIVRCEVGKNWGDSRWLKRWSHRKTVSFQQVVLPACEFCFRVGGNSQKAARFIVSGLKRRVNLIFFLAVALNLPGLRNSG